MTPEQARQTIGETFRQKFDDARFLFFTRNLVNHRRIQEADLDAEEGCAEASAGRRPDPGGNPNRGRRNRE